MEQHVCLVCAKAFDTGAILLDRRLRQRLERTTVTAWGLCPDDEKKHLDGYVALVAVDEARSTKTDGVIKPEHAHRTGAVAHVRREAFTKIFNVPAPPGPLAFSEPAVVEHLATLVTP
jgi:hypothetical protein